MKKHGEIKAIFKNVKGSWRYDNRFIIKEGSEIKHMDGECNAVYTQQTTQAVKRYRCLKCKKSTGSILIDNINIESLKEFVTDLSQNTEREIVTNSVKEHNDKNNQKDFDFGFFKKEEIGFSDITKEDKYKETMTKAFYKNEDGVTQINESKLKDALKIMPQNKLFHAYFERKALSVDGDTRQEELLLETLIDRNLYDKAKDYETRLNMKQKGFDLEEPKTKGLKLEDIEKKRLELIEKNKNSFILDKNKQIINTNNKIKDNKNNNTLNIDFTQFLNPNNIGKILGKSEIDLIDFIRDLKDKPPLDDDELLKNTQESFKMFIGWLQYKYGMQWMDYIPLICFASNQMTLIAKAVKQ